MYLLKYQVLCASFSHDGRYLASGSLDNKTRVYSVKDGFSLIHELKDATNYVYISDHRSIVVNLVKIILIWQLGVLIKI